MADSRTRAAEFLSVPTIGDKRIPRAPSPSVPGVQPLGAAPGQAPPAVRFSLFIPEHQEQALALAARFMEMANQEPNETGLQQVLDLAEQEAAATSIALVQYALMVFITHHPLGSRLPIPPLEARHPTAVRPSPPIA